MTPNPQDSAVALEVEREAIDQQVRQIYVSQGPRGLMQLCIQLLAEKARASQSDGTSGEWQAIETAPTFGSILLYWRRAGVCVGSFSIDDQFDQRPKGWQCPEAGWRGEADELIPRNQDDCTHWMPLPSAPNQGENHVG